MEMSMINFGGEEFKDIYFNGYYHDAMYKGSQLIWEKFDRYIKFKKISLSETDLENIGVVYAKIVSGNGVLLTQYGEYGGENNLYGADKHGVVMRSVDGLNFTKVNEINKVSPYNSRILEIYYNNGFFYLFTATRTSQDTPYYFKGDVRPQLFRTKNGDVLEDILGTGIKNFYVGNVLYTRENLNYNYGSSSNHMSFRYIENGYIMVTLSQYIVKHINSPSTYLDGDFITNDMENFYKLDGLFRLDGISVYEIKSISYRSVDGYFYITAGIEVLNLYRTTDFRNFTQLTEYHSAQNYISQSILGVSAIGNGVIVTRQVIQGSEWKVVTEITYDLVNYTSDFPMASLLHTCGNLDNGYVLAWCRVQNSNYMFAICDDDLKNIYGVVDRIPAARNDILDGSFAFYNAVFFNKKLFVYMKGAFPTVWIAVIDEEDFKNV